MLSLIVAAAERLIVAGGSITGGNSVLTKPAFRYSHHQKVSGMIVDIAITVVLIGIWAYLSYINWGPPAKRKLAAAGVDDADTLQREGYILGLQPWIWSIITWAGIFVVVMGSVLFYGK